jgi:hypothetical protein
MVGKMKSWRVWGLIFNFFGNTLAIYGLAGQIRDGSRLPIFLIGVAISLVCILILAKPSGDLKG